MNCLSALGSMLSLRWHQCVRMNRDMWLLSACEDSRLALMLSSKKCFLKCVVIHNTLYTAAVIARVGSDIIGRFAGEYNNATNQCHRFLALCYYVVHELQCSFDLPESTRHLEP